jgi:hypothetical protein
MSIASWKAEFYPMAVEDVPFDAVLATKHSLAKWTGFREANRARHGVELHGSCALVSNKDLLAGDCVMIDSSTCALCQQFYEDSDDGDDPCEICPLKVTLGMSCDDSYGSQPAPWDMWNVNQDPEPMIAALEQTLNRLDDQGTVD